MKVHGRCHCGAITFEADVDASKVTICHCRDCAFDGPRTYGLRIGALAERDRLLPKRRIWCRSALPWSENRGGLPQRPHE